jgi:hypothetical protein
MLFKVTITSRNKRIKNDLPNMKNKKSQKHWINISYLEYFATNIFNVMLNAYKICCFQNHKKYRSNVFDLLSTTVILSLVFSLSIPPIFIIYSISSHFFTSGQNIFFNKLNVPVPLPLIIKSAPEGFRFQYCISMNVKSLLHFIYVQNPTEHWRKTLF